MARTSRPRIRQLISCVERRVAGSTFLTYMIKVGPS